MTQRQTLTVKLAKAEIEVAELKATLALLQDELSAIKTRANAAQARHKATLESILQAQPVPQGDECPKCSGTGIYGRGYMCFHCQGKGNVTRGDNARNAGYAAYRSESAAAQAAV